jgi:hypothetical protein
VVAAGGAGGLAAPGAAVGSSAGGLPPGTSTGIGSLPFVDVARALDAAFQVDLPYLPQLPLRDPREFMLGQALEGLPGLVVDDQGGVVLDEPTWAAGAAEHGARLQAALAALEQAAPDSPVPTDAAPFLPSAEAQACFAPFVARVVTQGVPRVKAQLAGPMTLEWTLRTPGGARPALEARTQLLRTVLVRARVMIQALRAAGAEVTFFLDEPGLYVYARSRPEHVAMLEGLRVVVAALRRAGARVGLHCCSDADWGTFLDLGFDVLAFDVGLSLRSIVKAGDALVRHAQAGGRLALGLVPTTGREARVDPRALVDGLFAGVRAIESHFPARAAALQHVLARGWVTPACGLAFLDEADAVRVPDELRAVQRELAARLQAVG